MAMKQIHVNQAFCFIPKSYFCRSILGTVVMDQHWKSVMASVHNQRTSSSEKSGGMHHQILHYSLHMKLSQVWKHIRRYRINVKIWDCCRDLGPFPSTVGEARDLTQQIKLNEISDFHYK